mgnify:CR=1 FL=1
MISVIIADDHAVVRQGVTRILSDARDLTVVAEASSGDELIDRLLSVTADVCLLDLAMPGGGLDALGRLHELRPELRILVFSMHPEDQYAVRCLAAGASGYVMKHAADDELIAAVASYVQGRPEPASIRDGASRGTASHDQLSSREFQTLRLIGKGRTISEIAAELGLSVKTVSTYRTRTLTKMKMQTTAELMHYAIRHGLVE